MESIDHTANNAAAPGQYYQKPPITRLQQECQMESDEQMDTESNLRRCVWCGDWQVSLDGVTEVRASVFQRGGGFVPAIEMSWHGGDCEPIEGERAATLAEAVACAKHMARNAQD